MTMFYTLRQVSISGESFTSNAFRKLHAERLTVCVYPASNQFLMAEIKMKLIVN